MIAVRWDVRVRAALIVPVLVVVFLSGRAAGDVGPGLVDMAQADSASAAPQASTPGESDTVRVPLRSVRRLSASRKKHAPVWWTTVRSGILPGWGQLANGKPVKAILLAGVYTGLAVSAYGIEQDRKDLKKELGDSNDPVLVAKINDAVDRRNSRMWFMGATALFAMLDAYVDAHFLGYEEQWTGRVGPDNVALAVRVKF